VQPEGLRTLEQRVEESGDALRAPRPIASVQNTGDRVFSMLTTGFASLVIVALALMLGILLYQGWLSIHTNGFSFLTGTTWAPSENLYGAAPSILGTIYTSALALVLAGIVGVLVSIFLTEIAPLRIRFSLGLLVELLGAVPSIVYGLWAFLVLVPIVRQYIQPPLVDHFGNTPFFSGYPLGLGIFTATLILAVMILPTIAAISRDVIAAVPNAQREAMLALGATRWETTWKVIIPYARSGIIGALLLGLGRAVGETMAVQMVIGNSQTISPSLFGLSTTMPATIVNQFTEATGPLYRSALIEIALLLMAVTVILNAAARVLVWSVTRRFAV
jgi:phosphate transport system permease protein